MVAGAGLAALVSDRPDLASPADEAVLWQHEQAVESLMAEHDVLPARFGSVLEDDVQVRELLARRRAELSSGLRWVSGAVELSVRVGWPAPDEPAVGAARLSGGEYMARALERERRAEDVSMQLERVLGPVAKDSRVHPSVRPGTSMRAAYLVPKHRVELFRRRAAELNAALEEAELVCTGPWPPYSFTTPRGASR
jgi:hypothetical protein